MILVSFKYRHFLACLEESRPDAVKVAQCFVDQFDEFIIYAEYCTNYLRSVSHNMCIVHID